MMSCTWNGAEARRSGSSTASVIGLGYDDLQLAGAVVGERVHDRLHELGDADGRDEHDHAWRLGQPADDRASRRRCPTSVPIEHREDEPEPVRASATLPTMTASTAAAGTPRSPTAKLMTRLDR